MSNEIIKSHGEWGLMNERNIQPVLKKYPMSILLAIIAINLFSRAGTLKNNGIAEVNNYLCTKSMLSFIPNLMNHKMKLMLLNAL